MRYCFGIAATVFFSILLSGCQNSTKLSKYNPNLGKPSALIIVKLDDADYINIKRLDTAADTDEYTIVHPAWTPIPYKYSESLYPIEPGTYYISYAYMSDYNNDNMPIRSTHCDGLDRNQQPVYGAFTVHADEVLYLGDIKINWINHNPRQMFCMIDNLPCVRRDLTRAGYKELADRVQLAAWQK